jgi:hypothetical protein
VSTHITVLPGLPHKSQLLFPLLSNIKKKAAIIKHNCAPLVESLPFLRSANHDLIEAVTSEVPLRLLYLSLPADERDTSSPLCQFYIH